MKTEQDEYAQAKRILQILHLLGPNWSGHSAEKIQYHIDESVTKRTIYRDIKFLRAFGYKIGYERDKGYFLEDWEKLRLLERKLQKQRKSKLCEGGQHG